MVTKTGVCKFAAVVSEHGNREETMIAERLALLTNCPIDDKEVRTCIAYK